MNYPVTITIIAAISTIVIVSTLLMSIKGQLLLMWAYLPFVDLLKRVVFLDPSASSSTMYAILFTQDLFILAILARVFLNISSQPIRIKLRAVDIAVLLFAVFSAISALMTFSVPFSARIATIGMRVWPMLTYFLAATYLSDFISLKRIWKITLIVGVVVALYGIRQFFIGFLPFEELWLERASATSSDVAHIEFSATRGVFRTFGTLDSHSSYGLFLGMCLIFAYSLKRDLGFNKWFSISIVLAFGLILSFTRFTWLMPMIAVGFIFLFTYKSIRPFITLQNLWKASILFLFITSSFGLFYVAMSMLYKVRFVSGSANSYLLRAFGTGTLEARLRLDQFLGENLDLRVFGKGLAASAYFARKFDFDIEYVNYHNIFIDMIDSMGVVGLGFFLILLYLLIRAGLSNLIFLKDSHSRTLFVALFSLFLALLTVGHFNGAIFYFGRALPVYFWSIAGILVHFERPFQSSNTSKEAMIGHEL